MTTRHRKRSHANNRDHRRTKKNLKKRIFDADQVVEQINRQIKPALDEELPGGGVYYCTPCCKHFENRLALTKHITSKKHKRTVKELIKDSQDPWTQQSAEAAAGLMPEHQHIKGTASISKETVNSLLWQGVPSDDKPQAMGDM